MTEPTPHLGDEIQDLLDGRLDPAREANVRAHLAACERCRAEWQQLESLKTRLRAMSGTSTVPADLDASIRAALDREPREQTTAHDASSESRPPAAVSEPPRRAWRVRRVIAAGIAALLVLAIGGVVWWRAQPPTPSEVAQDYRALARGDLRLGLRTPDTRALEQYFASQGGLPTRVYDFGMMRYTLVGGHAHRHRSHATTIAVYQGEQGERLVCEMYAARPPSRRPIARRTHNGVVFTIYREGDVTMVFWDEGPVTCVLVSTIDPEALVQLAFAKAVRKS
jgi:hypothetical protein